MPKVSGTTWADLHSPIIDDGRAKKKKKKKKKKETTTTTATTAANNNNNNNKNTNLEKGLQGKLDRGGVVSNGVGTVVLLKVLTHRL